MELVFGCYVEAQGSHHEDEHDEEHDEEHGEEHESHANYAPVLADDDCAFYGRTDTSLKHVVDDSQMFGLKRSDVIGTWVLSTHLTPSSPERYLNALSEVQFFDDGTAIISETYRLGGDRPINI